MQLQSLEKEKQNLQDQLICHEEFHRGIFHGLERMLQTKDQILAPFHEVGQVENGKYPMQERLAPLKGIIEKDDSSYSSFPRQDGECSRMTEVRETSNEEVLHKPSPDDHPILREYIDVFPEEVPGLRTLTSR
jgi:hypothetical protein